MLHKSADRLKELEGTVVATPWGNSGRDPLNPPGLTPMIKNEQQRLCRPVVLSPLGNLTLDLRTWQFAGHLTVVKRIVQVPICLCCTEGEAFFARPDAFWTAIFAKHFVNSPDDATKDDMLFYIRRNRTKSKFRIPQVLTFAHSALDKADAEFSLRISYSV